MSPGRQRAEKRGVVEDMAGLEKGSGQRMGSHDAATRSCGKGGPGLKKGVIPSGKDSGPRTFRKPSLGRGADDEAQTGEGAIRFASMKERPPQWLEDHKGRTSEKGTRFTRR